MNTGMKIAIVGLGVEGRSVSSYLLRHGYKNLTVCDENNVPVSSGVKLRTGAEYLSGISDFDVVFRSPGVHLDKLVAASKITSATQFFFEKCPCPIIGVSGTKGKGTCASLIFGILGNKLARLGGNIGVPALDFLDDLGTDSLAVLELSSFQLQDLTRSPRIAVLLNTTSDHLDYHSDVFEYRDAKSSLLKYQEKEDFAILNRDYEYFDYYSAMVRGRTFLVSREIRVFDGAYVENGGIYFARDGESEFIMKTSDVGLLGAHNLENVLPAVCVGGILGISGANIAKAVREFRGLPHRIEFVREVKGVRFYNDSCSTNPETSIAAVKAFTEPLTLIAGGSEKGADFARWGEELCARPNLRTVILIGKTADKLEESLMNACGDKLLRILRRPDLDEAVLDAYSGSEPGSVVLLSPGCASFDMFKNYKDRGEAFTRTVLTLSSSF